MAQRRRTSLIESLLNIGSGFVVALCVWEFIIEPVFGIEKDFVQNLGITTIFTSISICRSYAWRRGFNWLERKGYGNSGK